MKLRRPISFFCRDQWGKTPTVWTPFRRFWTGCRDRFFSRHPLGAPPWRPWARPSIADFGLRIVDGAVFSPCAVCYWCLVERNEGVFPRGAHLVSCARHSSFNSQGALFGLKGSA